MKTRMTLLFTASVMSINTASSADADLNGFANKGASPALRNLSPTAGVLSPVAKVRAGHSLETAASDARIAGVLADLPVAAGNASAVSVNTAFVATADLGSLADKAAASAAREPAPAMDKSALPIPTSAESLPESAAFEAITAPMLADMPVAAGAGISLSDFAEPVQNFVIPSPIKTDIVSAPAAIDLDVHVPVAFAPVDIVNEQVPSAGALPPATALSTPETAPSAAALPIAMPVAEMPAVLVASVELPEAPAYAFFDNPSVAPVPTAMAASGALYSSENVSLEQAIAAALETNPEVNQAIMNKEAIEFEREQAQGLYAPRVDLEASAGIRRLENGTRRALAISNDELFPVEVGVVAEQTLIDFGRRHGELMRQAARTDGAALRVAERSENIALLVSRQYLDILLQQRIVAAADDNVTFHRNLVRDLGLGVTQGSISIADQQQAQERLQAAAVRKTEAEEALLNAQISLQTLTGLSVNSVIVPVSKRTSLTPTVNDAIAQARQENPKVLEAMADVDAAHAMIEKANGDLHPTIGLEGRARIGNDIDGFKGETNDLQARVVLRWNMFDGGINRAKVQEMVRRASESRFRLHELVRYAEEDVRRAWNSMSTQDKVGGELEVQSRVSDDLLLSYREQFNVGRRSLLDVLDAQNTRYNVQVRLETARFAEQFAEYQVLAATNNLLDSMSLAAPSAANAYAREKYDYGPSDPAETNRRRYPR